MMTRCSTVEHTNFLHYVQSMNFSKTVSLAIASVFFVTSCVDVAPSPSSVDKCADDKCLSPQDEPPPVSQADDSMSIAAEECLWCLGAASEACLDENEDCLSSIACKAWKECTESCVVNDSSGICYDSCDASIHTFFTPTKVKTCNCDICYAQCFNMCPEQ